MKLRDFSLWLVVLVSPVAFAQEPAAQAVEAAKSAVEQARKAGAEREAPEELADARSWLAQADKANAQANSLLGRVATAAMKREREEEIVHFAAMARLKAETAEARAKKASILAELKGVQKTLADFQGAITLARERQAEADKARSVQATTEAERRQLAEAQRRLAELETQKTDRASAEKQKLAEMQAKLQALEQDRAQLAQTQAKMQALEQERAMVAAAGRIAGASSRVAEGKLIVSIPVGNLFTPGNEFAPQGKKVLEGVGDLLKAYPRNGISVRGHTDNRGAATANQQLSDKRAQAVRAYLVLMQGIPPDRIAAEGVGPAEPVANNATDAGRALNRRVEVSISLRE